MQLGVLSSRHDPWDQDGGGSSSAEAFERPSQKRTNSAARLPAGVLRNAHTRTLSQNAAWMPYLLRDAELCQPPSHRETARLSRLAPFDKALVLILVPLWLVCFGLSVRTRRWCMDTGSKATWSPGSRNIQSGCATFSA